eukprot:Sdes_comp20144_c0_seq1m13253
MKFRGIFLGLLLSFLEFALLSKGEFCTQCEEFSFATKTQYCPSSDEFSIPKKCKVLFISQLTRHGSRFPSKTSFRHIKNMEALLKNHPNRSQLPEWLQKWSLKFSSESIGHLSPSGHHEMYAIGQRTCLQYRADFWGHQVDPGLVDFHATKIERTSLSANSFWLGFMHHCGSPHSQKLPKPAYIHQEHDQSDGQMRFYNFCKLHSQKTANSTSKGHYQLWKNSSQIQNLLKAISEKISLPINDSHLNPLYYICVFEYVVYRDKHWCDFLFTKQDLMFLQLGSDLKLYYKKGPGFQINLDMSQALLMTLYREMSDVFAPNSVRNHSTLAAFRFGHSETLIPVLGRFGFGARDSYLTSLKWLHDPFVASHPFMTSLLSPFAANLRLVLLDCEGAIRVAFALNEAYRKNPHCQENLCTWEEFHQIVFPSTLGNSTFDQICQNE